MRLVQKIAPCLWFDSQAEEAARFYTGIFPQFQDRAHLALWKGGFNEAVSFQVVCETQNELDSYWQKLSQGGDPKAHQCGCSTLPPSSARTPAKDEVNCRGTAT